MREFRGMASSTLLVVMLAGCAANSGPSIEEIPDASASDLGAEMTDRGVAIVDSSIRRDAEPALDKPFLVDIGTPDVPVLLDTGASSCRVRDVGSLVGPSVATGVSPGGASLSTGSCGGAAIGEAVLRWTAPSTGTFTFDTRGSTFDTLLYVRSNGCAGTELACNDDIVMGTNIASSVSINVFTGQALYLFVDGFDAAASGSYVVNVTPGMITTDAGTPRVDVPTADPCAGVTVAGRCATPTSVEFCAVPSGFGDPQLDRFSCASGERCVVGTTGYAECQLAVPCREGDEQCLGTSLRRCVRGSWVTTACPRECISSPIGDFCSADIATRTVTGRVTYIARGPNDPSRPTDWSTTTFTSPAQSFLVLSVRQNTDGTQSGLDVVTTSTGNADGGRFSIRVPTVANSSDRIIVAAVAGDGRGGIRYLVASPGFSSSGMQVQTVAVPPAPTLWSWRWQTSAFVSGDTLNITEAMGSGAARIFDYLRYTYGFAQEAFGRDGLRLVAWLQFGTSWSCGKCVARVPTTLFGSATSPGQAFGSQAFFDGSTAQAYWADSVTAHEFGHWVMSSYSAPPSEGGRHVFGGHVYPGMAWSEGFATWFSADVRNSSMYYDKIGSSFFWFNIAARQYAPGISRLPWERPTVGGGLEQTIDENEVASMLWTLSNSTATAPGEMYRALASARMQGPRFARGYRAWRWSTLDSVGDPTGATRSTTPAPYLADFLDALRCNGFSRSFVDAATQPSLNYPYPSASPLCF